MRATGHEHREQRRRDQQVRADGRRLDPGIDVAVEAQPDDRLDGLVSGQQQREGGERQQAPCPARLADGQDPTGVRTAAAARSASSEKHTPP
jgi:hypothetical protein